RHDTVLVGIASRENDGMTRTRLGDAVLILRLAELGALGQQQIEAARAEVAPEPLQIVGTKLVDRDHHQEPGPRRLGECGGGREQADGGGDYPRPDQRSPHHWLSRRSNSCRARAMSSRVEAFSASLFHPVIAWTPPRSRSSQAMKYRASSSDRIGSLFTLT